MAELKPCPFCGGDAEVRSFTMGAFKKRKFVYVECSVCGNRTSVDEETRYVEKAWNRRVDNGNQGKAY